MSVVVKSIMKKAKRQVKSKKLKVVSICSVCGEPVSATTKDNAYRHGFNRYVTTNPIRKIKSQEDGKPCAGSGQPVNYKKR